MDRPYNVLFLCTGNSARSIMAEALLDKIGGGRFQAYSAGSHPRGDVHPLALDMLQRAGMSTTGFRSKSWDEFARPDAPRIDFVFTVCDNAAMEVCPIWPGQPMTAHWGLEDPAAVSGSEEEQRRAFMLAFRGLEARIRIFTSLRPEALDRLALQRELDRIGKLPVDKIGTFLVTAALLFVATATTRAQEPPPDIRAIAAVVADEQAHIAALQRELEQQSAALAELMRRLELVTTPAAARTAAPPAPPEPLDTTLPSALLAPNRAPGLPDPWVNRFYWDVTYRY